MTGVIPHSAVLATQFQDYLKDCLDLSTSAANTAQKSHQIRNAFKTSLAAYCVLAAFSKKDLPLVNAAAEIARRTPLLLATRQRSLFRVELRRFIELATWYPYFSEHPVEWGEFVENPNTGFVKVTDNPISYCAHRERTFYANYIKERYGSEKSGLVISANNDFSRVYSALSFHVHATGGALNRNAFSGVLEKVDDNADAELQKIGREIMSAGCLIFAAVNPARIHKLGPIERGWFDWLIGSARSKKIRAGEFCEM